MLYGALVSAIDPAATQLILRKSHVPPVISEIIFGERSLNNAITAVLFNLCEMCVQSGHSEVTFANAISLLLELIGVGIGSLVLAAIVGYSSAYLLCHANDVLRQHQVYEVSIVLLFAYTSYLAFFHLSGHLSVFVGDAFIRRYHVYSISKASATTFRHLLTTMSFLS
uniref:Cation/H+ exchanger transmembrane domain-containing protein n=1 Tax=Globisporangium ultimum (strain ATCC 200006 / CBS 805.95 / DAOM BR144) TaxID=431595 RepID=K3WWY1_GLOUD